MNLFPIQRDVMFDDGSSYITTYTDFKSDIRNLKIELISNKLPLNINIDAINRNKKILNFILDKYPDAIITGSLALNLYGLINRDCSDIDLIDSEHTNLKYSKNAKYEIPKSEKLFKNRLGSVTIKHKIYKNIFSFFKPNNSYLVDFYLKQNESYQVFNFEGKELKLHNPLDIIILKNKLKTPKHINDIFSIFENVKKLKSE